MKTRKSQSDSTGIEEGFVARRQRQISGSESETAVDKVSPSHRSEKSSGSQSDDAQAPKHRHRGHRR